MQILQRILAILLLCLLADNCWSAGSFDSYTEGFITSGPVLTVSATNPDCANVVLIVGATKESGGTFTSLTYNGDAMTQASTTATFQFGTGLEVLAYLLAPDTGTNDIVATFSDVTTDREMLVAGWYCGFDGIGNVAKANENVTLSLTTTVNGSWVISSIGGISPADFSVSTTLSDERREYDQVNHSMALGDGIVATAGAVTVAWTSSLTASQNGTVALELKVAATPSGSRRVIFVN